MNLKRVCSVEIYSSDFCHSCKKAEAFFKNNGVYYCKTDITSEEG